MTNTISPCNRCSSHWPDPWEMLTVWLRKFSCIDFLCFLSLMQLLSSFKQCNSSWDGQTWVLLMQQLISWLPSPAKFVLDEWLAQGAMIQIQQAHWTSCWLNHTWDVIRGRSPLASGLAGDCTAQSTIASSAFISNKAGTGHSWFSKLCDWAMWEKGSVTE